jgi:hypothetical protein
MHSEEFSKERLVLSHLEPQQLMSLIAQDGFLYQPTQDLDMPVLLFSKLRHLKKYLAGVLTMRVKVLMLLIRSLTKMMFTSILHFLGQLFQEK